MSMITIFGQKQYQKVVIFSNKFQHPTTLVHIYKMNCQFQAIFSKKMAADDMTWPKNVSIQIRSCPQKIAVVRRSGSYIIRDGMLQKVLWEFLRVF